MEILKITTKMRNLRGGGHCFMGHTFICHFLLRYRCLANVTIFSLIDLSLLSLVGMSTFSIINLLFTNIRNDKLIIKNIVTLTKYNNITIKIGT